MSLRQRWFILVRHAHAEWPAWRGDDFERPLTPQGLADAAQTAEAIVAAGHRPSLLLTSPARRTAQTAGVIAAALELPDQAVQSVDALYNAAPSVLEAELRRTSGGLVLLVAHNPGISELARALSGNAGLAAFRPAQWMLVGGSRESPAG